MNTEGLHRVYINLNTVDDVNKFTEICSGVKEDIRLKGLDENGSAWDLSAKSLLSSLIMMSKFQTGREHTAHEVDWNTIYVECEKDIYNLLSEFAK